MADIDTGGGNAINAAQITERLIQMGVAGVNIEDQVFPKRCGHMEGKQVIAAEEMAGKVRAMADVRRRLQRDIVINARTDSYAPLGLDEAIRRSNLYLRAGADMVFIDGIRTRRRHPARARRDRWIAIGEPDGRRDGREDATDSDSGTGGDGGRAREHSGGVDSGGASGHDGVSSRRCTTRRAACWKGRPDGSARSPSTRRSWAARNIESSRTSICLRFRSSRSMERR